MTKSLVNHKTLDVCPNGLQPAVTKALLESIHDSSLELRDVMKLTKLIRAHGFANGNCELVDAGTGHLNGPVSHLQAQGVDVKVITAGRVGNGVAKGPGFRSREDREAADYIIERSYSSGLIRTTPLQWGRQKTKRDGHRLWTSPQPQIQVMRKGKRLLTEGFTLLQDNKEELLIVTLAEWLHNHNYSTDLL